MVGYMRRAKAHSVFSCQSGGIGKFSYSRPGYSRNGRWAQRTATHARPQATHHSHLRRTIRVRIPPARFAKCDTHPMRTLVLLLAVLPLAAQKPADETA